MKNCCLMLFWVLLPALLSAQSDYEIALRHLTDKAYENGYHSSDLDGLQLLHHNVSSLSGVKNFYFQQMRKGREVYAAIFNVHLTAENKLLTWGSRFVKRLDEKVAGENVIVEPEQAVLKAADYLGYPASQQPLVLSVEPGPQRRTIVAGGELSEENLELKLVYQPVTGDSLRLAWDMTFAEAGGQNRWSLRIDAATGAVLDQHNLVLQCDFGPPVVSMAATKEVDAAVPLAAGNLDFLAGTYNVYALPVESPNHGSRSLLTNPDDPSASPYGWHDTNGSAGAEYTYTRGNNVYAQVDDDDNNSTFGYSPDGGPSLNFDFSLDLTQHPSTQQDAIVTNLFYANNVIHDIVWHYGFDEAGGNFQFNNYGNGGSGNDHVIADAQDAGGTNNANMSTPSDGSSPRMQMYLWSSSAADTVVVNSPAGLAGNYTSGTASFGPQHFNVTGDVVLVDDGVGTTGDGCQTPFLSNVSGKIAMMDRSSSCQYSEQAYNAQTEGAIAVIICNNVAGGAPSMGNGPNGNLVTIPVLSLSQNSCNTIKTQLPAPGVNATLIRWQVRDSDLDNGVILHEYTHGISNRLTGSPSITYCLQGDEQMGEGWSDWYALMLTMKSSDTGPMPRGIGTWLIYEPANGTGIRTYPYSTDMVVNPHTYNSIKTESIPHGVGSVWCAMLWELTWKLIDQYGFSANFYSGSSGNNKALALVTEAMKLQPCNPGFVDGRDAILAADQILYGGANQCLIWEAFAKRGLGYSAVQGNSDNRSDGTEAFDLPPFCQLAMTKSASTGTVSPGDQITYTIDVENLTSGNITSIAITDDLPANTTYVAGSASNGGTYSGGTVSWPAFTLSNGQSATRTFAVQVDAGAPTSTYTFSDGMESGSANWTTHSTNSNSTNWVISGSNPHTGSNGWFADDVSVPNEQFLYTKEEVLLNSNSQLTFWHHYDTETNWDGGRVFITTDNGVNWTDLGPHMTSNGYNGQVDNSGIPAFSGNSGGYIQTVVNLSAFAGQFARFRFWMHCDISVGSNGWYIDDVAITNLTPVIPNTASATFQSTSSLSNSASLANPTQLTPALPLELLSFNGRVLPASNLLSWTTIAEENVKQHTVQRSLQGTHWVELGSVPARNIATVEQHYDFEDVDPPALAYYRLRSEDLDGSFRFSPVVVIERDASPFGQWQLHPNPTDGVLFVRLSAMREELLGFTIRDALSREVGSGIFEARKGFNEWQLNLSELPAGLYWFGLSANGSVAWRKVLVTR